MEKCEWNFIVDEDENRIKSWLFNNNDGIEYG